MRGVQFQEVKYDSLPDFTLSLQMGEQSINLEERNRSSVWEPAIVIQCAPEMFCTFRQGR